MTIISLFLVSFFFFFSVRDEGDARKQNPLTQMFASGSFWRRLL